MACDDQELSRQKKLRNYSYVVAVLTVPLGVFLFDKAMNTSTRVGRKAMKRASLHKRVKMLSIM